MSSVNKKVVDMGILTSSKDNLLRQYYDDIVNSSLDLRNIHRTLLKKNIERDIIWGIIGYIGMLQLTEEEYKYVEEWINLGEQYFDDRTMKSLFIHIERSFNMYAMQKGIIEKSDDTKLENFDFEEHVKKFEVNSIVIKQGYTRYNLCYTNDEFTLCDRYNDKKQVVKGVVLYRDNMKVISKDSNDESLLSDKTLYRIV